jgi:hypothetical protein
MRHASPLRCLVQVLSEVKRTHVEWPELVLRMHSLVCTPVTMSASTFKFSLVCQLFENLSN